MKRFTTFFILLFLTSKIFSQRVEIGGSLGVANYLGDLAPTLVVGETRPAIGIFGRYNISPSFALTGSILGTQLTGNDKNFSFNKERNLSFKTDMIEYSGVVEFNFFKYGPGVLDKKFTSYVFIGLSVFDFNPQAQIEGKWVDLREMTTEGQSKPYGRYSVAVPFGIGLKWMASRSISIEWQLGFRKTYTDYLDDVSEVYPDLAKRLAEKGQVAAVLSDRSVELNGDQFQNKTGLQRGNPDFKDWYIVSCISIGYRIYNRSKCARFY